MMLKERMLLEDLLYTKQQLFYNVSLTLKGSPAPSAWPYILLGSSERQRRVAGALCRGSRPVLPSFSSTLQARESEPKV